MNWLRKSLSTIGSTITNAIKKVRNVLSPTKVISVSRTAAHPNFNSANINISAVLRSSITGTDSSSTRLRKPYVKPKRSGTLHRILYKFIPFHHQAPSKSSVMILHPKKVVRPIKLSKYSLSDTTSKFVALPSMDILRAGSRRLFGSSYYLPYQQPNKSITFEANEFKDGVHVCDHLEGTLFTTSQHLMYLLTALADKEKALLKDGSYLPELDIYRASSNAKGRQREDKALTSHLDKFVQDFHRLVLDQQQATTTMCQGAYGTFTITHEVACPASLTLSGQAETYVIQRTYSADHQLLSTSFRNTIPGNNFHLEKRYENPARAMATFGQQAKCHENKLVSSSLQTASGSVTMQYADDYLRQCSLYAVQPWERTPSLAYANGGYLGHRLKSASFRLYDKPPYAINYDYSYYNPDKYKMDNYNRKYGYNAITRSSMRINRSELGCKEYNFNRSKYLDSESFNNTHHFNFSSRQLSYDISPNIIIVPNNDTNQTKGIIIPNKHNSKNSYRAIIQHLITIRNDDPKNPVEIVLQTEPDATHSFCLINGLYLKSITYNGPNGKTTKAIASVGDADEQDIRNIISVADAMQKHSLTMDQKGDFSSYTSYISDYIAACSQLQDQLYAGHFSPCTPKAECKYQPAIKVTLKELNALKSQRTFPTGYTKDFLVVMLYFPLHVAVAVIPKDPQQKIAIFDSSLSLENSEKAEEVIKQRYNIKCDTQQPANNDFIFMGTAPQNQSPSCGIWATQAFKCLNQFKSYKDIMCCANCSADQRGRYYRELNTSLDQPNPSRASGQEYLTPLIIDQLRHLAGPNDPDSKLTDATEQTLYNLTNKANLQHYKKVFPELSKISQKYLESSVVSKPGPKLQGNNYDHKPRTVKIT